MGGRAAKGLQVISNWRLQVFGTVILLVALPLIRQGSGDLVALCDIQLPSHWWAPGSEDPRQNVVKLLV